jgi:predicted kinase
MKELFLLRGMPGAGKSTIANFLNVDFRIASDDYFTDGFDYRQLPDAHDWCQFEVESKMILGNSIAVANTFTREWEMTPYFELAEKYGYRIHTIIIENRHGNQSIHDVPKKTIKKMIDRFDISLHSESKDE